MTFPAVQELNTTDGGGGNISTITVPLPTSPNTDGLLLVGATSRTSTTTGFDTPSGWTLEASYRMTGNTSGPTQYIFSKKVAGGEGTSVDVVKSSGSSASETVAISVYITGWSGTLTDIVVGGRVSNTGSDSTPDGGGNTTGSGSDDKLYYSFCSHGDDAEYATAYPGSNQAANSTGTIAEGTSNDGVGMSCVANEETASSYNYGNYTLNATARNTAIVLVIKPGTAGNSGGHTSTAAMTVGGNTLNASGSHDHEGTAAMTVGGNTLNASGSHDHEGTAAMTVGGNTLNASGLQDHQGTAAMTVGSLAYSASAEQAFLGTGVMTLGGNTYNATGSHDHEGTAAMTLGGNTYNATGSHDHEGTAALAFGKPIYTAQGARTDIGTGVVTFSKLSVNASGAGSEPDGTGSIVFSKLLLNSEGSGFQIILMTKPITSSFTTSLVSLLRNGDDA